MASSQTRDWQDVNQFPISNGKWEMYRLPVRRLVSGENAVRKAVANWYVFDPVLVSTPQSERFLPPILLPEFRDQIFGSLQNRYRVALRTLAIAFIAFICWILFLTYGPRHMPLERKSIAYPAVIGLFYLYVLLDFRIVQRSLRNLGERAMLIHWAFDQKMRILHYFVGVMLVSGALQIYLLAQGMEPEDQIEKLGVYFKAANAGQLWRYLTGPFLHVSVLHWLGNLLLGVLAFFLANAFGRRRLWLYFAAIAAISLSVVQFLPSEIRPDAIAGVSGGIFGVYGWVAGYCWKERAKLPVQFCTTVLLFSILNIVIATLLSENASFTAHVLGFVLGGIAGLLGCAAKPLVEPSLRKEVKCAM